ncbi:MAG TPA: 50S ribosomal protein L11 methyltransferase [Pyrinomonadaceae bacterium]|nr:50S ribosomal protein L11 methyltransferase [Pyrinomonadaceae bacterium]
MWYAVDVDAAPDALEAVEYALMEAGARGTEQGGPAAGDHVAVAGYFETEPEIERVRAALLDALRIYGLQSPSVRAMRLREVETRDWLGEWKKNWRAAEVGRFVVAPPWDEVEEAGGRIVIRIEPGMAFGTGTHETTRLCLAAIEKHFDGASFLDVGTGTGILAIAAARLRPAARIEACDTDAEAVEIARENARLNGVGERVEFRVGSVEAATRSADFVCANLTADVIVPLVPALAAAACGRLVLSGILAEQTATVLGALHAHGVSDCRVERDGEWVAIIA